MKRKKWIFIILAIIIAVISTYFIIKTYAAESGTTGIGKAKNEDALVRLVAGSVMGSNTDRTVTSDAVATEMANYISLSKITVTDDTARNVIVVTYKDTGNQYEILKGKTYTVTYNANGGSGGPGSQLKIQGTDLTLSSTKPTRTGYTFLGWYTSEYKDHPLYYYADTYSDLKEAFGYDEAKLYNHWINNGQGEGRSVAPYSAGGTYTADAGITLYAGWRKNEQTFTESVTSGETGRDETYGEFGVLNITLAAGETFRIDNINFYQRIYTNIDIDLYVNGVEVWNINRTYADYQTVDTGVIGTYTAESGKTTIMLRIRGWDSNASWNGTFYNTATITYTTGV